MGGLRAEVIFCLSRVLPVFYRRDEILCRHARHLISSVLGRRTDVREDQTLRTVPQRVARGDRFWGGHIQTCCKDPSLAQGLCQCGLVDDLAPGCIDQDRMGFHPLELIGSNQVAGLSGQWAVDADDIALAQEFPELHAACCELLIDLGFWLPGRVKDTHVPAPMEPLGDRHSDSSHTDNPKRLAFELLSEEPHGLPVAPLEFFDVVDRRAETSTGRKDQPDGDVGRRVGQDSRGIANLDRAGFGGRNVDVVVADGEVSDPSQRFARSVHNLRIDRIA